MGSFLWRPGGSLGFASAEPNTMNLRSLFARCEWAGSMTCRGIFAALPLLCTYCIFLPQVTARQLDCMGYPGRTVPDPLTPHCLWEGGCPGHAPDDVCEGPSSCITGAPPSPGPRWRWACYAPQWPPFSHTGPRICRRGGGGCVVFKVGSHLKPKTGKPCFRGFPFRRIPSFRLLPREAERQRRQISDSGAAGQWMGKIVWQSLVSQTRQAQQVLNQKCCWWMLDNTCLLVGPIASQCCRPINPNIVMEDKGGVGFVFLARFARTRMREQDPTWCTFAALAPRDSRSSQGIARRVCS